MSQAGDVPEAGPDDASSPPRPSRPWLLTASKCLLAALLGLLLSAAAYSAERTQEAGNLVAKEKLEAGSILSQEAIGADGVEFSDNAAGVK